MGILTEGQVRGRSAVLAGVATVFLLAVFNNSAGACTYATSFGDQWFSAGQLSAPDDVATDSEGNAWVLDSGHGRVKKFDSEGGFALQFSSSAEGIAVDSGGDVWTVSSASVKEYSDQGALLQSWNASGEFISAADSSIAVDPEGKVWVSGRFLNAEIKFFTRVKKFTTSGEELLEFGSEGTGNGQFKSPEDIAADSEGNVLIADTGNHRIQEFNGAGEFVRKYGTEGSGNGQFKSPKGVAVDSEGRVWVADAGNNRMQRFSSKGAYQTQFGSPGPNDGQFSGPQAIAVDPEEGLWVADTGNNRVQGFDCP